MYRGRPAAAANRVLDAARPLFLLGAGAVVLYFYLSSGMALLLIVGCLAIVAAVGVGYVSRSSSLQPLDWIQVSPQGVTFGFADGRTRRAVWTDRSVKLTLSDYRNATVHRRAEPRRVPCAVYSWIAVGGISPEALQSIRRSAIAAGVSVIDTKLTDEGRSTFINTKANSPPSSVEVGLYD